MVPTLYLALLEDVKTVKSYAWGAAMLAYLGLIIALEFIKEVNGHPREFPLMVQWHQKMVNFDPYARLDEYFLPLPYNRQVALKRCLTSIICIEKRIIYDPSVLMKRRLRKSHPLHDIPQTAPTQEHELEDVMQDHTEQEQMDDISEYNPVTPPTLDQDHAGAPTLMQSHHLTYKRIFNQQHTHTAQSIPPAVEQDHAGAPILM
ncbi:hypothetical protein V6N13_106250 [Hibiscus sabdariffa]